MKDQKIVLLNCQTKQKFCEFCTDKTCFLYNTVYKTKKGEL